MQPFNFPLYANQAQEQGAGLIPAPSTGSFTAPTAPSGSNYPGLAEYMGLELTEAEVRANMPEYLPAVVQVAKPLLGFFPVKFAKMTFVVNNNFSNRAAASPLSLDQAW